MATVFVLRNTQNSGVTITSPVNIALLYDMVPDYREGYGASVNTAVTNTTASGTDVTMTKTAGGSIVGWISAPFPQAVTITTGTISVWIEENNMSANIGGRVHLYRWTTGTSMTELGGSPFSLGTEAAFNGPGESSWATNFTDTAFSVGDRLVIVMAWTNVGTMASGFTGTLTFNDASGNTGDSFFSLNETLGFPFSVTPAVDTATLADIAPTVNIVVAPLLISTPTDTTIAADIAPTVQRWQNVWLGTVTIVLPSGPLITTPLDTLTLTDSVSIRLPFLVVNASDAITLFDDSLTMFLPKLVFTTSDLVTLSDPSVTVVLSVLPGGTLQPNVLDTLTVLDVAPILTFSRWNIEAADILTLSEGTLSVQETPIRLNVSDLLTGAETVTVTVFTSGTALSLSVIDIVSVREGTLSAGTNPVRLVVSETLRLGEGNVYVIRYTASQRAIYLADTLTLADVRYVRFPEVMEPLVPVGLIPTGLIPGASTTPDLIEIQTEDILTLVDLAPAVLEPVLKLSVLDAAALFETVLVREPVLPLLVSDLITSADTTVTLQLTPLLVQASDLVTMAEGTLVIRTVLTLTIAPAADVVTTSDIAPVFAFSLWNIAAADTLTVSEDQLTVVEPILPLTVSDTITLSDSAQASTGLQLSLDFTPTASVSYAGCPTGDFSVAGWFRFDTLSGFDTLFYLGATTGNNSRSITLYVNGGVLEVWGLSSVAARFTSSTLTTGRWYHLALVGNTGQGQTLTLYLNGIQAGTGTTGSVNTLLAETFSVGDDRQGSPLDGQSARIHVLASQITAADIHELMMSRTIGTADYLTWVFPDVLSSQPDSSGNGRIGVVSGTTAVGPSLPLLADPTDVVTTSDAATVQLSKFFINVTDSLTLADLTPTVSTATALSITTPVELVTSADIAPVFFFSRWNVQASDTVTLSEATPIVREPTLPVSASDVLTVSDQGATLRFSKLLLQALDTATLAEAAPVIALGQLRFLVTDPITLVDGPASLTLSIPFISQPGIVISIPSRDMSVTATVTLGVVSIPARDMSIAASPLASSISVPARDMSITATVTLSRVSVPARDMSIAA